MNELFAGYSSYASTQAVLTESLITGYYEQDPQSSSPFSVTLGSATTFTFTFTWTI